ncbi:hypothetical protein ABEB36_001688 [Hypothenemus hampei]|uniref:Sarcospan n=1 Tax=Hypothenemus hampei TaxID=57062 RepID=A0ABD1FIX4_HYPHA
MTANDQHDNNETDLKHHDPIGNNNGSIQSDYVEANQTQAVCLMTTVPQNYASRSLGGKHTPTRNSLRHSRMIVMYRNGRIPRKYLPFVIKHYRLVKSMKVITIVLGILMCLLSVLMVLWSPTLRILDYPYWSAVPVLVSGVFGCFFLGFCPRPYPNKQLGCHYHLSKFVSITTTVISISASIFVLTLCIVHLVYLHTATCTSYDNLNTTCVCSIEQNSTSLFNESYHYGDFTCEEVDCFLRGVLATVCVLNILVVILELMYLGAQWDCNLKKLEYTNVPLKDRNGDEKSDDDER